MASKQVNVAIIGLGFGAEFIPIYQRHPNAELWAICQRSEGHLNEIGDQFGAVRRHHAKSIADFVAEARAFERDFDVPRVLRRAGGVQFAIGDKSRRKRVVAAVSGGFGFRFDRCRRIGRGRSRCGRTCDRLERGPEPLPRQPVADRGEARLDAVGNGPNSGRVGEIVTRARGAFRSALQSDLNTAAALAAVFDLVRDVNAAIDARQVSQADAKVVREAIAEFVDQEALLPILQSYGISYGQGFHLGKPLAIEEVFTMLSKRN